jgi:sulfotransferase family protein
MPRPDFFIVGAPRCGTTAMYTYLRQHPQVFMPEHKEPMYFGADLTQLHVRLSERDYVALFSGALPGQRVGEASTWYLYSKRAPSEIHAFNPDAQIVIMLRNPVDVMYSLHRELVFYRGEAIDDFEEALAAEADRRQGLRVGPSRRPEALFYRDTVRFADQVERYLDVFGAARMHVILYDDFVSDTPAAYAGLLRFLGVDDGFRPDFVQVNESKLPRNRSLQAMVVRPPAPFDRLVPLVRRFGVAHRLRAAVLSANSRPEPRPALSDDLRRSLTSELAPEVARLGHLIGRDLTAWSTIPAAAPQVVSAPT